MKRLLLAALLFAGQAHAEWVMYGDSGQGSAYYDPATVRRTDHGVMVWKIDDLRPSANGRVKWGWVSTRILIEYRCASSQYRVLQSTAHSLPMADGSILFSSDEPQAWSYVAPGTIGETLKELVCPVGRRT
jgi:hypothetical protein